MSNVVKQIVPGTKYTAVPGRSPEEAALMAEQTEALKQQRALLERQLREQNLLSDIAYREAGLKAVRDPATGEITSLAKLSDEELDPELRQKREIERLFGERSLAALRGELPEDPALHRQLGESKTDLETTLRRNLGTGYATSTPGIEALAEFEQRKTETLEGARRGDLTLAEQLGIARESSNIARPTATISNLFAPSSAGASTAASFGSLAAGYNAPLNRAYADRSLEAQVGMANMQQWLNRRKAVASTFSSIFSSAMGGR